MLARAKRSIDYRDLLYNLVVRDLKVRYKHSVLGFFWSLLNPVLLMLVFTFVFQQLLGSENNPTHPMYHVFFLVALLPWNWCASAVTGTLGSIVNSGYLIKKVYFPREMLPVAVVLANMINFLLALPALVLFMIILRPEGSGSPFGSDCQYACFNAHLLWVPLLILTQTIFLTGLGFFISALNVFFRDTSVLVEVGLSAWFFLTPIIYDARDVAHDLANLMYYLNPMASLVANFREVFYYNDAASPDLFFMLRNLIVCTVLLIGGYLFFMRLSHSFGEEI
ncbi:MAG: ABC transporter permease [Chloroflexota bacterium]